MMLQFQSSLLGVWQEIGRHLAIHESTATIAELLREHLPLRAIMVRQLNRSNRSLVTVASTPVVPGGLVSEDRRDVLPGELTRLMKWGGTGEVLRRDKRSTGLLSVIVPSDLEGEVVAVPLTTGDELTGALVLVATTSAGFLPGQIELAEMLRGPFSAALENDRRIHEMARLREAAEAERGALLRRLGRTDLTDKIVGEDSGLRPVIERIDLVGGSDVPVLVLGETGTGKELVARAIHNRSPRRQGPFIKVNCGAIPAELIDSQLFGHERGSFTGADQARQGWFERADGGTLLLDEIGELPLEAQVRFLRVLQDGFIERVGGTKPVHVNVRIVAATHRDLAQMTRDNRFREDLWYRLAVFPILLPPLRDRRDDIPALARHFAERAAHRFSLAECTPTEKDIALLQSYRWPGNIRELGAVIDRAAILGNGRRLEVSAALGWTQTTEPLGMSPSAQPSSPTSRSGRWLPTLDETMRVHIERVLEQAHGRIEGRHGAAAVLDINPHTLRARMRKLGINWSRYREREG